MIRKLTCFMVVLFSSIILFGGSTLVSAQTALPDYTQSPWVKTVDHTRSLLYKGEEVNLRDVHYGNAQARASFVVYYHPETGTEWFSVYMPNLYEQKDGKWVFVANLLETGQKPIEFLDDRYDLVTVP